FDPVFSDPSLLLSPIHLLIVQSPRSHSAHSQCFFFFFRSALDQHRANQHYPDRGLEVMQPHRTVRGE
ncbi:unnamed protein product, partial [Staurois parvus]